MIIFPEALLKELERGATAGGRVFVVYGEDYYYRDLIAAAIEKQVFQDAPREEREITVFAKNLNPKELASAVNSYPLFAGHSLVVVNDEQLFSSKSGNKENGEKEIGEKENGEAEEYVKEYRGKAYLDALEAVFSNVPDYCTVLISVSKVDKKKALFKRLAPKAKFCPCNLYLDNEYFPKRLKEWLRKQARQYGARFDKGAEEFICEYLATLEKAPLLLLRQELEKLAVYASPRKVWTCADVENVFATLPGAEAFSLMRLMARGRLVDFLRVLSIEKKKGTYILPICGLILRKLRELLRYRELEQKGYASGDIVMKIGSDSKSDILAREAKNFTVPALKEALLAVAALSRDIRKGGRDFDLLEEIIIRLFRASKRS